MITKRQDPEWLNDTMEEAIQLALDAIFTDGEHHKQWYLDQIVRVLVADDEEYQKLRKDAKDYGWDEGIAP